MLQIAQNGTGATPITNAQTIAPSRLAIAPHPTLAFLCERATPHEAPDLLHDLIPPLDANKVAIPRKIHMKAGQFAYRLAA